MLEVIKSSKIYFILDTIIWFVAHNLPILLGLLIQSYFDGNNTIQICILVLVLVLGRIACILIGANIDITAQHHWANHLYHKAYSALTNGDIEASQADFVNAINEDVDEIVSTISYMIDTACNLIYGIIVIIILARIDIGLTAFVVLFPCIAIFLNSLIRKKVDAYSKETKDTSNEFSNELLKLLNHSREIRVNQYEEMYTNRLNEIVDHQKQVGRKYTIFKGMFSTFSSMVTDCNLIVILFWLIHYKTLSAGSYVLFITYSFDLSSLTTYISTLVVSLQSTKTYVKDFNEKIKNIMHPERTFEQIESEIEKNKINILIGKNGSGKSMCLSYLYKTIPDAVLLPENFHLMNVSKDENIYLDQPQNYTNEFLSDIPNDHVGNENLSGGQQFRMALMRTLLTNSDTILIDNNFMNVDENIRKIIFEYLKQSKKTIVFTDHMNREEYKSYKMISVNDVNSLQ